MDRPFGSNIARPASLVAIEAAANSAGEVSASTRGAPFVAPWLWVLGLLLAAAVADVAMTGTVLITPIDRWYLNGMRLIGLIAGIAVASELRAGPAAPNRRGNTVMLWLVLPVMGAMLFDMLAWHFADRWLFRHSAAAWEQASYPVTGLSHGNKSNTSSLGIDPFDAGETTHIPIPNDQYRALRGQTDGLCVTVMQRKAPGGAIQVRLAAPYLFSAPTVAAVAPCGTTPDPWR